MFKKYRMLGFFVLAGVLLFIFSVTPSVFADESEPNDSSSQADMLTPPSDANWGDISPIGDVDWWVMGGASVDDLIFIYIDSTVSTSLSTDSVLNVYANDGTTQIEYDDDDGPGSSSVVAGALVPQAGDVYFRVHEFGNDNTIYPYDIYAAVLDPVADSMSEVEPNDTWSTATLVSSFKIVNGNMPIGGDLSDFFSFYASAGTDIAVSLDEDPDGDGFISNTLLEILGADGSTVLAANVGGDSNAAGAVTVPVDGTYYVRVSNPDDVDTEYRFVIHGLAYSPPTPTPTPSPAPVPTISQWGMIGMGILLAAALVWAIRRRWVVSTDKS
jgi:hypothetical protein